MLRGIFGFVAVCMLTLAGVLLASQGGAALMYKLLEQGTSQASPGDLSRAQAIAVLGGRTERIHYGAELHARTGLPLLLIGRGSGDSGFRAESQRMDHILRNAYQVAPRWVETESRDTHQNAVFSWCLVAPAGIRRIALVTDPFHMLRAQAEFRAAGFDVISAPDPAAITPVQKLNLSDFVPDGPGMQKAKRPREEWLGFLVAIAIRGFGRESAQCAPSVPQGL